MLQTGVQLLVLPLPRLPVPLGLLLHLVFPRVEPLQEPVPYSLSEELQQFLVRWIRLSKEEVLNEDQGVWWDREPFWGTLSEWKEVGTLLPTLQQQVVLVQPT